MKPIYFYIFLIALLVSINSGAVKFVLDNAIGSDWSSPIVKFLEEESKGILVVFLISLFIDFFSERKNSEKEQTKETNEKIEKIVKILASCNISIRELDMLLENKFNEQYGVVSGAENLIKSVLPPKKVHTNVNVFYTLNRDNDCDTYRLDYRYEFQCNENVFYIAFLTSSDLQDQLTAVTTSFFDMFVFSDRESMDKNISDMHNEGFSIKAIVNESNGVTIEKHSYFKRIPKKSYPSLLPLYLKERYDDIIIYCANFDFPQPHKNNYIYSQSYVMNVNDGYCYWVSDRTLLLNKIEINYTNFTGIGKVTLQPFLANNVRINQQRNRHATFTLNVNNWIIKGQGVAVIWS